MRPITRVTTLALVLILGLLSCGDRKVVVEVEPAPVTATAPRVTIVPTSTPREGSPDNLTTYYIDTDCADWVVWEQVLEPDGFYTERAVFRSLVYGDAFAFLRGKLNE